MEEGGWQPPAREEREKAIAAPKARHDAQLKSFLIAAEDSGLFPAINAPEFGDWLASHKEKGQTASSYISAISSSRAKKIYIQPLGDFVENESPSLATLQEFAELFLCVEAEVVAPIKLREGRKEVLIPEFGNDTDFVDGRRVLRPSGQQEYTIQSRMNGRVLQLLTGDIHKLLQDIKPVDAYCIMAITMEDLYPQDSWNFVFGQANMTNKAGVFSFARYSPFFQLGDRKRKEASGLSTEDYALLLRRSCKVMVHEIIHLFGVKHCIYYQCCMNGSNHLQESDSRPVDLCPVDLHKLAAFHHHVLLKKIGQFDIERRYRGLLTFYETHKGFEEDAAWVAKVLRHPVFESSEEN